MNCYLYLRASTDQQDATRAREELRAFAAGKDWDVVGEYIENKSGASLDRPELHALIKAAPKGSVLLIEQIDRLSRLKPDEWDTLKRNIQDKGLRIVSLDIPTSYNLPDEGSISGAVMKAVNNMLIDIIAAMANKDYNDRRRRQAQGIQKAQDAGKYKGRPVDTEKHRHIKDLLEKGFSYSDIQGKLGVSRGTIAKVAKGSTGVSSL